VAEYREIPRIFGLVRAAIARGELPNDKRNPTAYTLGTGHCRFFYNKLDFLHVRMRNLAAEMIARGYKPQYLDITIDFDASAWFGSYVPTEEALAINRARIRERSNVAA
jgi:hypothetical protein